VDPSQLPAGADFSMAAGDFLEVYTDAEAWDCVCSCFFLDTAANIVAYIEVHLNIVERDLVLSHRAPPLCKSPFPSAPP
jgi:carnosine N-methyltransferase